MLVQALGFERVLLRDPGGSHDWTTHGKPVIKPYLVLICGVWGKGQGSNEPSNLGRGPYPTKIPIRFMDHASWDVLPSPTYESFLFELYMMLYTVLMRMMNRSVGNY